MKQVRDRQTAKEEKARRKRSCNTDGERKIDSRKKKTPRGRWGEGRERGNDGLEASHSYTAGESLKAQ